MLDVRPVVPERVLRGAAHPASVTFYEDGAVVDPGVVTVKVDREDGTNLLVAGTPTSGVGATARNVVLMSGQTATLDVLKLTWTSPTKGVVETYVEIVGGYLIALADIRGERPLDNATTYTAAELADYRTIAEMALEEACAIAFVPRYRRDKLDGSGDDDLVLPRPRPLALQSASIDGVAITPLTDVELYRDGTLYYPHGWTAGRRNVEVKYDHGYAVPPPRVGLAVRKLVKRFAVDSPIPDRATSWSNDDGQTSMFVTAGVRDAVFDVPEANVCVELYGQRFGIA